MLKVYKVKIFKPGVNKLDRQYIYIVDRKEENVWLIEYLFQQNNKNRVKLSG